jgi:hypothetical protein
VRGIAAVLVTFLLTGCATEAQLEARHILVTAKGTQESFKACLAPIEANPNYSVLYNKIAVAKGSDPPGTTPSTAQLNDPERITDNEIATSLRWYAEFQVCAVPAMEAVGQISPDYQRYFVNNQLEVTDIVNDIVTTKPTFGHINQRLAALRTREKAEAAQLALNLRNSLLARHQEELEDRAEVTQQVLDAAVSVALSLSTRQTVLIHSQRAFVAAHPRYASDPNIKTVHCATINKTLSCSLI